MAGLRLPIESHVLQALVSEPVKPVLDTVVTSGAVHFYISQSDKGELVMGGDLDFYNSYGQRGNLPAVEHVVQSLPRAVSLLRPPAHDAHVGRRHGHDAWTAARSSANCRSATSTSTGGWCYGGFKATPASGWCFAHTIAHDAPHPLNAAFTLERFAEGRMIDEKARGLIAVGALR